MKMFEYPATFHQLYTEKNIRSSALKNFKIGYKKKVDINFLYQYKSNPEIFAFYNQDIYLSIIKLNSDFFNIAGLALFTTQNNLEETINLDNFSTEELSEKYHDSINNPDVFMENELSELDDLNHINVVTPLPKKENEIMTPPDYDITVSFAQYGEQIVQMHYDNYSFEMNITMSNKDYVSSQPFNHLNLNSIYNTVKSDTFKYQMNQGLTAYKYELYLPAAATFAVAIETLLVEIIVINDIKHKDSDLTMYDKLLDKLRENNSITYRNKRRIEVAYQLRNVISHTQAGHVAKSDCDFMINTIKNLVDEYKDQFYKVKHIDDGDNTK